MLLSVEELISVLRSSVNVQIPIKEPIEGEEETEIKTVIDPAYLVMEDEDLMLFIKLAVSRAYPQVSDLKNLPEGSEYPIILLAKIELYTKLAVLKADKVDMGADNNNYLKQDQRFQHYMKLVSQAKEQYESWLENEGQGEVKSYDVLLSNRHYTRRNYERQVAPKVTLSIDRFTTESVNFHWRISDISHFGRYKVYISKSPIVDMYREGVTYDKKVSEDARLVYSTNEIRNNFHELKNLESGTTYYIAVFSIERNQVFGYAEESFTTVEELKEEEEVIVDSL